MLILQLWEVGKQQHGGTVLTLPHYYTLHPLLSFSIFQSLSKRGKGTGREYKENDEKEKYTTKFETYAHTHTHTHAQTHTHIPGSTHKEK